jgi:two-component system response regulator
VGADCASRPKTAAPSRAFIAADETEVCPRACTVVAGSLVRKLVLIVEDDSEDQERIARSFDECTNDVELQFVGSAEEAMECVFRHRGATRASSGRRPSLILLETELARGGGRELLRTIRKSAETSTIPVVIFSKRRDADAIRTCYRLGANSYFAKPDTLDGFRSVIRVLETYWLRRASLPS